MINLSQLKCTEITLLERLLTFAAFLRDAGLGRALETQLSLFVTESLDGIQAGSSISWIDTKHHPNSPGDAECQGN